MGKNLAVIVGYYTKPDGARGAFFIDAVEPDSNTQALVYKYFAKYDNLSDKLRRIFVDMQDSCVRVSQDDLDFFHEYDYAQFRYFDEIRVVTRECVLLEEEV